MKGWHSDTVYISRGVDSVAERYACVPPQSLQTHGMVVVSIAATRLGSSPSFVKLACMRLPGACEAAVQ